MPTLLKCSMRQKLLTKKLFDTNNKQYTLGKGRFWVSLFNDGLRPVKWNQPTTQGTLCTCTPISNDEDKKLAMNELNNFINQSNEKYPDLMKVTF
jgi:hypothetical protein